MVHYNTNNAEPQGKMKSKPRSYRDLYIYIHMYHMWGFRITGTSDRIKFVSLETPSSIFLFIDVPLKGFTDSIPMKS